MSGIGIQRSDGRKLCCVIQDHIRIGLIKTRLTDLFRPNARRGDVCYCAVLKFDTGVRRIHFVGYHGNTDCTNFAHLHIRPDQPLNRVEVVDHHVEHDIDIKRAIGKRRNAVYLKIQRSRNVRLQRDHRRIVPLKLADH